uniref:Putative secreted protein n=1 Tax=Anopheles darlingi TaxID=43151 RepID=A0A2M4DD26_ANODA
MLIAIRRDMLHGGGHLLQLWTVVCEFLFLRNAAANPQRFRNGLERSDIFWRTKNEHYGAASPAGTITKILPRDEDFFVDFGTYGFDS